MLPINTHRLSVRSCRGFTLRSRLPEFTYSLLALALAFALSAARAPAAHAAEALVCDSEIWKQIRAKRHAGKTIAKTSDVEAALARLEKPAFAPPHGARASATRVPSVPPPGRGRSIPLVDERRGYRFLPEALKRGLTRLFRRRPDAAEMEAANKLDLSQEAARQNFSAKLSAQDQSAAYSPSLPLPPPGKPGEAKLISKITSAEEKTAVNAKRISQGILTPDEQRRFTELVRKANRDADALLPAMNSRTDDPAGWRAMLDRLNEIDPQAESLRRWYLNSHSDLPADSPEYEALMKYRKLRDFALDGLRERQPDRGGVQVDGRHFPNAAVLAERKLPRGPDADRRNAEDLILFRSAVEEGVALGEAQRTHFRALEYRNALKPFIEEDIDGPYFLQSMDKFRSLRPEEQNALLYKLADSRHPRAEDAFLKELHNLSTDRAVHDTLRKIAAFRGIQPAWDLLKERIIDDLKQLKVAVQAPPHIFRELREMPESMLREMLEYKSKNKFEADVVRWNAARGLHGRDPDFIGPYASMKDPFFAQEAVAALEKVTSDKVVPHLKKAALQDEGAIANAAISGLLKIRSQAALEAVHEIFTKYSAGSSGNLKHFIVANPLADYSVTMGKRGRLEFTPRVPTEYSGLSQPEFVSRMLSADHGSVMRAMKDFELRPVEATYAVLKHPDARVRAEMAQHLFANRSISNTPVIRDLLEDPVAEVRLAALSALQQPQFRGSERARLLRRALGDDSDEVRQRARWILSNESGRGMDIYASRARLAKSEINKIRSMFDVQVREPDLVPLALANHVYTLPEFAQGGTWTGQQLVSRLAEARMTAPNGYRLLSSAHDAKTGFKYGIYEPIFEGRNRPIYLSFAGTQGISDIAADATFGRMQAGSRMYQNLLEEVAQSALKSKSQVVISGHSLGGGLSEMFAHDLAKRLGELGVQMPEKQIRAVTGNPMGAVDTLKRLGRYDAQLAGKLNITNYRLTGDAVSRIGQHIGEVVEKNPESSWLRQRLRVFRPATSHGMNYLEATLRKDGALEKVRNPKRWSYPFADYGSLATGAVANVVQELRYARLGDPWIQSLLEARRIMANQEGFHYLKPRFDWFRKELDAALGRLSGERRKRVEGLIAEADAEIAVMVKEKQMPVTNSLNRQHSAILTLKERSQYVDEMGQRAFVEARRRVLENRATLDLEDLRAALGLPPSAIGEGESTRLRLLREEHDLALREIGEIHAQKKPADPAKAQEIQNRIWALEHQLAGESRARATQLAGDSELARAARRGAVLELMDPHDMRTLKSFAGPEQVLGKGDANLAARREAELVDAHATAAVSEASSRIEREEALRIALEKKQWPAEEVDECIEKGICLAKLDVAPQPAAEALEEPAKKASAETTTKPAQGAERRPASHTPAAGSLTEDDVRNRVMLRLSDIHADPQGTFRANAPDLVKSFREEDINAYVEKIRGYASNPDMIESMRVAYGETAKVLKANPARAKDDAFRQEAFREGVRRMLQQSGFDDLEIEGKFGIKGLLDRTIGCLEF